MYDPLKLKLSTNSHHIIITTSESFRRIHFDRRDDVGLAIPGVHPCCVAVQWGSHASVIGWDRNEGKTIIVVALVFR